MKITEKIDTFLNEGKNNSIIERLRRKEKISEIEMTSYRTFLNGILRIKKGFESFVDTTKNNNVLPEDDIEILKDVQNRILIPIPYSLVKNLLIDKE